MPIARSSIFGILAGVLVLAGFVGFVVGLPEVVGDSTEASAEPTHPPLDELLPDELLDGGLVRIGDVDPSLKDRAEEADDYSTKTLTDVFEAESAVARYANADLQGQLSLTITEADASFFMQNGPPAPAELTQAQGVVHEFARVDGVVCAQMFEATQDGSDPAAGTPLQVQCQTEALGLTFNVYAVGGLTAEQAVEVIHDAIAQAEAASEDEE
jgi:hypothetical protein